MEYLVRQVHGNIRNQGLWCPSKSLWINPTRQNRRNKIQAIHGYVLNNFKIAHNDIIFSQEDTVYCNIIEEEKNKNNLWIHNKSIVEALNKFSSGHRRFHDKTWKEILKQKTWMRNKIPKILNHIFWIT